MSEPRLLKYINEPDAPTLKFYLAHDGYKAAEKVLKTKKPDEVIDEVKKSGLRGQGGAGFPCGSKWSFVPKDNKKPKYLVINADESEPGSFKDRLLIDRFPHQMLEGIIIAAYAIGSKTAYIYIRGENHKGANVLQQAIDEAYEKNFFGTNIFGTSYSLDVTVHRGAGAYICGEETALLSSLEGGRGYPKIKPPFPAVEGLFRCPTVVNNVETLSNVPHIFLHGAEWFKSVGTENTPGTKIFGVSGHVKKPGLYELPFGTSLRDIIFQHAGGLISDKKLKAVIPGGSSSPILKADEIDLKMDFKSLADVGSMLGTAGIVVLNEDTCMVNALWNLLRFYAHESCGQCTPCREGTGWLAKLVGRIEKGGGTHSDLAMIQELSDNMVGKTICVLADAAAMPAKSYSKKFFQEFEEHVKLQGCPFKKKGELTHA
ncbi:MAG: NADH-quinone oxidoreductase subunit NuoF [Planctomycetota bacterium]